MSSREPSVFRSILPVIGPRPADRAPLGIEVSGIRKSYGAFRALDDVSIQIGAGEFVTLLGPSGSGKTTLLNIIAGFARPDRGRVMFGKDDVTLRPVNHRDLGMVFQNYALFPHMSVGENVAFPLKVRRVDSAEIRERVAGALKLVKLDSFADRNVAALSGGQRQRVALARAVVFSPQIVLMDEPLSALDKNLREDMQVEIRQLHRKIRATTVYVTHDQREALTMSDRVAVMNEGRIVQFDTPDVIYNKPTNTFVAGFIGETSLLPAKADAGTIVLPCGSRLRTNGPLPTSANLRIALRAERIHLPEECTEAQNLIPVTVIDAIYQGDSLLVLAETSSGHRLSVRKSLRGVLRAPVPIAGAHLTVGIEPQDVIVLPWN